MAAAKRSARYERRIDGLKPNVRLCSIGLSAVGMPLSKERCRKLRNHWDRYRQARMLLSSPGSIVFTAPAHGRKDCFGARSKDPLASNVLYVKALAAPFTINTMPELTLIAVSEQTKLGSIMAADGGDCEEVLTEFSNAGIDIDSMAAQLQEDGAKSFSSSWNSLMAVIASKGVALEKASVARSNP